jgi:GH15 family glucan-1,4-alpha-glucosidase
MKNHADKNGGIIASSDTDILNQGRDTYSYVWPRDSALTALALSRSGYSDVTERYFSFIAGLIEPGGYLMHKYRVDGVLGSSWHPWVRNGTMELPIQEDETALVLYALGEHYERSQNIEFIESLYNSFIEPAADFLAGYIDPVTNLPQGSYDLWEEKYGTSTYTASAVFGALLAATRFSSLLGKRDHALRYQSRAEKVAHGIMHYLYDPLSGTFVKRIYKKPDGTIVYDRVLDMSSVHGVLMFGVLAPHDLRASRAFDLTIKALHVPGPVGGYMRYEGDNYYRTGSENPPNPWCITTLWVAQQYIRTARTQAELQPAYEILEWVQAHASPSGMLPEQLNPHTGAHLSTSPLVWSHAEFVHTVYLYHTKYRTLKK